MKQNINVHAKKAHLRLVHVVLSTLLSDFSIPGVKKQNKYKRKEERNRNNNKKGDIILTHNGTYQRHMSESVVAA